MGDVLIARATCLAVLLVSVSSAWAQDAERSSMAHLRLTTEPGLTAGCVRVGAVSDDSIKDLRRKIVKAGGNAAGVSFEIEGMSTVHPAGYPWPTSADPPFRIPP